MTDGIVHELQRAANDPTKSVTEVLRLALTAASKLGLKGTTTWIRHELEGYPNTKDLPPYRCIRGKAQGRNPIYGWQPVIFQGDDHQELIRKFAESVEVERFTQPVSALQELLKQSEKNGRVLVGLPDEAIRLLSEVSGRDTHFTLCVGSPMVAAAIDSVRNTVLEWALSLEAKGIHGEGYSFTAQEKRAAVEATPGVTYITVSNSSNVNVNNAAQHGTATQSLAKPYEKKTGLLAIFQSLLDIWNKLPNSAKAALKGLSMAALGAAGAYLALLQKGCN